LSQPRHPDGLQHARRAVGPSTCHGSELQCPCDGHNITLSASGHARQHDGTHVWGLGGVHVALGNVWCRATAEPSVPHARLGRDSVGTEAWRAGRVQHNFPAGRASYICALAPSWHVAHASIMLSQEAVGLPKRHAGQGMQP
jgi:hypothetical protein